MKMQLKKVYDGGARGVLKEEFKLFPLKSNYKRIGGFSVRRLRKLLRGLDGDNIVGIYMTRKSTCYNSGKYGNKKNKLRLAPCHVKGRLLAPILEDECDEKYFRGCSNFENEYDDK